MFIHASHLSFFNGTDGDVDSLSAMLMHAHMRADANMVTLTSMTWLSTNLLGCMSIVERTHGPECEAIGACVGSSFPLHKIAAFTRPKWNG